MKVSKVVVAVGSLVQQVALVLNRHVVMPSIRIANDTKAFGLSLAVKEADAVISTSIDEAVTFRKLLETAQANIRTAEKAKLQAAKAVMTFSKERMV